MTTPNITKTYKFVLDQSSIDAKMFMKDIQSMIPPIVSSQMVDLIDSGKNINNIMPKYNKHISLNNNGNNNGISIGDGISLSGNGILLNGISGNNGNETSFSSTSKKYSPYVYYNKNLSEKFM